MLNRKSRESSRKNAAPGTGRSITRDLTISLVLVVAIVSISIISVNIWFFTQKSERLYKQKAAEYIDYLHTSLELPMWNLDEENIKKNCASFVRNELVSKLIVTDNNGVILFQEVDPSETDMIERTGTIQFQGQHIGSVEIGLTSRIYKEQNRQVLWSGIITTLMVILVLMASTSILLKIFLRNPFNRMIDRIDRIAGGDYETRDSRARQREFETILSRFNDMSIQIKNREANLTKVNALLQVEIKEREEADKALRESEEKFRAFAEQSVMGIFILRAHRPIYANQAMADILNYPVEEMLQWPRGEFHTRVIFPDDQPSITRRMEKRPTEDGEGGAVVNHTWRVVTGDGVNKWVETFSRAIKFGGKTADLMMMVDITARKRAEEENVRLRNYLKNVIDSMPSILVGVDEEERVTQWNLEAEKATGISAGRASGQALVDVFPRLAREVGSLAEAIRDRRMRRDPRVEWMADGQAHFEDVTVYPLIANGVEGAVIRVDDVTERVHIEEMMIQSEKMLSVGGLAAGMAHEINNPLAGILQNVQVIRNRISKGLKKNNRVAEECGASMEIVDEYMRRRGVLSMIDSVTNSGKRAAKIVDNMLSFSRKSESAFAPHNLGLLLDQTLELAENDYDLKKKFDFRQIEIIREYALDMPETPCEASKIQQVFLNILKNGAQAMAEDVLDAEYRGSPRFIL
ncbi:MAG: PAS domain S-box protein, partial [Desulfobacterales bacterium]|nr:PAS domain S-box protein [Desulfobacterales bacterium]